MLPYYQDNTRTVYNKSCTSMDELPDESVQCVVTSPPYFGLRKYTGAQEIIWGEQNHHEHSWQELKVYHGNGGGGTSAEFGTRHNTELWNKVHDTKDRNLYSSYCSICGSWRGSFGLEPDPIMYVEHTIQILKEIRRVLKNDGVIFWNIDDSYAGANSQHREGGSQGFNSCISHKTMSGIPNDGRIERNKNMAKYGIKMKDLCLIPFRVAIGAQEDGWFVRSVIIWAKSNPMPESVKDRPTSSHEYILLLTKSANYYWNQDAIRQPIAESVLNDNRLYDPDYETGRPERGFPGQNSRGSGLLKPDPKGANCKTIWPFNTHPYPDAHFATFPEELPERCIKAGSKEGDLVLDPFAGSGTTLFVATRLNRKSVGYEISEEYCKLIVERNKQMALGV